MAFCETWLDSTRPDDDIILDGFTLYRSEKTMESGKTRGRGLCIYINNRWCSNVKIHTTLCLCSPNLELLTLSVRPFYLPREFSNIVLCCVYVSPSADALAAADNDVTLPGRSCVCYGRLYQLHSGYCVAVISSVCSCANREQQDNIFMLWEYSQCLLRSWSPSSRPCRPQCQCHQPHPSVATTVEESQADQGRGSTMDSGCHHAAPGISGLTRLGCVCTRFRGLK